MITRFAIKNNVLTISILVVLVLSGIMVFNNMPRDDMPPFLIRFMSIVTAYPGAGPDRIENLITDPLEKVIQEVPEVDYISSESRTGISIVNVALKDGITNLQPIFDRIRRKVEEVETQLPDGAVMQVKDELGDVFGIIIGLTADGYTYAEMKEIADEMRDELIKLPNAAKVEISGVQKERIFVEFNDTRLAELGLTQKRLQDIIGVTNIVIPGGDIQVGDQRLILEPSGNFESLDDLSNIIVSATEGKILRLKDVAAITRGYLTPRQSIVKFNGREGLAIAVNLIDGGNISNLGKEVDEKLDEFRRTYPHGVELVRAASQDSFVAKSVRNFMVNLAQAVVAVLVSMLMLLGLRTGLIVASLIPVAIVTTLLVMSIMGVGLNQVSLAALIISLGIMVDNAIVISEAIMVKMETGTEAVEAAVSSAKELIIPLLTSSLTTSAAFMSFFLAESVMGEIMGVLFVVVTISLLSSWLLSLTMITLFCVYGLKQKTVSTEKKPGFFERFSAYYKGFLLYNLHHRRVTFTALGCMMVAAFFLVRFVPVIFMPKSDRTVVSVNMELPIGTDIERTSEVVDNIAAFIRKELLVTNERPEGVETWSSYVGEGAPKYDLGYMPPETNSYSAHILVNTTSDGITDHMVEAIDEYMFAHFPEATYTVSRLASGGGSVTPIEIRISGDQIGTLYVISEQIKSELLSTTGTRNITDNWGLQTKKVLVDIQNTQAQIAGVTNYDIAVSLQTMLGGAVTGVYREEDKSIPIVMQNSLSSQLDIEALEGLNIYAQQSGKSVPLKQVANLEVVWQPSKILRRDLTRTITIGCDVQPGFTANEVLKNFSPWLRQAADQWPEGYAYELGGDAEGSAQAMAAVAAKLPLSMFIIILLLIAQFNSIRKLVIILATIPLGLIGVILGLLVTGSFFSFTAFLGIISLAGIVINNGIVLLDRINIEQNELNKSAQDAVTDAAMSRFRPILLTTATTSLGLIPLWLGGGEMWEPMAVGIIFGLLFSTLLTLVFAPVLYSVLFRIRYQH